MTAAGRIAATANRPAATPRLGAWAVPLALLAGLGSIVAARWLGTRLGVDPLVVGAAFGVALCGTWLAVARGVRRPQGVVLAVAAGAALGLALVGIAIAGTWLGGALHPPGIGRPAAPFAAWAVVTIVVATAEEGILRGVLFDRVRVAGGTVGAIAITTVAFALIHVPLYGWGVVPLDLAVGLALAGLRLSTRTVVAPSVAHAVADLATWWL